MQGCWIRELAKAHGRASLRSDCLFHGSSQGQVEMFLQIVYAIQLFSIWMLGRESLLRSEGSDQTKESMCSRGLQANTMGPGNKFL